MENKTIKNQPKTLGKLTDENMQIIAESKLKKIHTLIYKGNYERAITVIEEGISTYQDDSEILAKFEINKVILLIKSKKYEEAEKLVMLLQKKYADNCKTMHKIESLMLEALLGMHKYSEVIDRIPNLIKMYPEYKSKFESQKIEAYLGMGRNEEALYEATMLAQKYPEREKQFLIQKFQALIALGRYEEVYSINPEDVTNTMDRDDIIKFGRIRVEALALDSKIEEALAEIESLRMVYNVKKAFFGKQLDLIREKREENKVLETSDLIEMSEEDFMKYARKLDIKQFTFLQVARYKHEKREKIALETIEEYKRRTGKEADLDFTKKLKQFAMIKKKSFDFMKWGELAKKLNLEFKGSKQNLSSKANEENEIEELD